MFRPYTKQLITLVLWCAPPKYIGATRRGDILLWLDAFAKWSMIDIYLLVISLVSFRMTILSPNLALLPDTIYSVELMVIPMWGLYANMIAQLISQISSHFIIFYHRKAVSSVLDNSDVVLGRTNRESSDADERKIILGKYHFSGEEGEAVYLRKEAHCITWLLAISVISFFICGCALLPSFRLDLLGIVGLALEAGNEGGAKVEHSLFTIVQLIMDQAQYLDDASSYVGLGSLCLLFIATAFVVPAAQTAVLFFLWFTSMKVSVLKRMMYVLEILQAWQYAEVFVLSLLVTTLQLGKVSTVLVNDYCGSLESLFVLAAQYGVLDADNAQCLYIESTLQSGFYVLMMACFMLLVYSKFVGKVAKAVIDEEELASKLRQNAVEDFSSPINDVATDPLDLAKIYNNNENRRRKVLFSPQRFFGIEWLLSSNQTSPEDDNSDMTPSLS